MASFMSAKTENALARTLGARVGLSPNDPTLSIESLSGGNQQKVVVGRWLDTGRRLLIAEDPTAGVDVGAKAEIYHLLFNALASGMGVLVVSTDFEEIANICHRAIVFSRGQMVAELSGDALSTETLIQAASAADQAA
jgi:ribose transport system ATP-binding protein